MDYHSVNGDFVHRAIENIGFGMFQMITLSSLGLRIFVKGCANSRISILEPYLRCYLDLGTLKGSWLVTAQSIARIFGPILMGKFADQFGRKRAMVCLFAFHAYLSLISALSTSYTMVLISWISVGLVYDNSSLVYPYAMEVLPSTKRKYMTFLDIPYFCGFLFGIAGGVVSLNYLNWRWYIIMTETVLMLMCAFVVQLLPASPRYLYAAGDTENAIESLKLIAQMNKVTFDVNDYETVDLKMKEDWENQTVELSEKSCGNKLRIEKIKDNSKEHSTSEEELSKWSIYCRIFNLSLLSLVFSLTANGLMYASMQLTTKEMHGIFSKDKCIKNMSFEYILSYSIGILFSFFSAYFIIGNVSRRKSFRTLLILLCLSFIPLYFTHDKVFMAVFFITGTLICLSFYHCLHVYYSECLPTSVRALGIGICNLTGNVGKTLSSFLFMYLINIHPMFALVVVNILTIAGTVAGFLTVVETKDMPLRD